MKLSVSLPDRDVEFVDRYIADYGEASRSAVLQRALRLLRERELGDAYEAAWDQWADDGGELWESAAGDGIESEPGDGAPRSGGDPRAAR
jgi:Arc/MetJ-type ribon-helix-helix transcriptional regulator